MKSRNTAHLILKKLSFMGVLYFYYLEWFDAVLPICREQKYFELSARKFLQQIYRSLEANFLMHWW